jgi:hypothetical protein
LRYHTKEAPCLDHKRFLEIETRAKSGDPLVRDIYVNPEGDFYYSVAEMIKRWNKRK